MDKGTESLLNVGLSVLAPVLILDYCSGEGDAIWQMGATAAMCVALTLPIGYGIYHFIRTRRADAVNIMGLMATLLTAFVTMYATMGEGEAIRPDTPWWYAIKEASIPLFLAAAIILTARGSGSLLRVFIYTDGLFHITRVEQEVEKKKLQEPYQHILWKASLMTAASLVVSSVGNFFLSLYFLLPVIDAEASEQAELYNYAVSDMTWMGYLVIGLPIMGTFFYVIFYLLRQLRELTGLPREEISQM